MLIRIACTVVLSVMIQLLSAQLVSSNLPIIVINTHGQDITDEPKIMADMGIIWNGDAVRNSIGDPHNEYDGKIGIEIRGQSSQMFPMKSYSIELWDNNGASVNRSLFGMPQESDWVLYAPYNDKTLMHNFLAYTLSNAMGNWAAHCRYAELVLNGEYRGIYVLMEKIKRKSGRVNVSSMGSSDNSGDAVTGGYIFSIDKEANGWYSQYNAGAGSVQFSYVYPKETNITNAQKEYIRLYTDSFENALHAPDYQHKQSGWRRFADEKTFVDYFIINELSRNVDGYRLSSYFHKDRFSKSGKIKAGPVWDYDLAFRNADYCHGSDTDGWSYQFNSVCPGDYWQVPFWWDRLLADTAFRAGLKCRWKELRAATLSAAHLNHLIDSIDNLTAEARTRHFAQWPVLGEYVWPNPQPIPASYPGEIQALKQWLATRLKWIDTNLPNTGGCADYPAAATGTFMVTMPNPYSIADRVLVQSKDAQPILVKVMDAAGKLMWYSNYQMLPGNNYFRIPVNNWQGGIYFMECRNENGERLARKMLLR